MITISWNKYFEIHKKKNCNNQNVLAMFWILISFDQLEFSAEFKIFSQKRTLILVITVKFHLKLSISNIGSSKFNWLRTAFFDKSLKIIHNDWKITIWYFFDYILFSAKLNLENEGDFFFSFLNKLFIDRDFNEFFN